MKSPEECMTDLERGVARLRGANCSGDGVRAFCVHLIAKWQSETLESAARAARMDTTGWPWDAIRALKPEGT